MFFIITRQNDDYQTKIIALIEGEGDPEKLYQDYLFKRLRTKPQFPFDRESYPDLRRAASLNDPKINNLQAIKDYKSWELQAKFYREQLELSMKEFNVGNEEELMLQILVKYFGFQKKSFAVI